MNSFFRFVPILLASLLLTSCAAPGPKYANVKQPEAAIVRGKGANVFKFAFTGDSNVSVIKVDGQSLPPPLDPLLIGLTDVYVSPGRHYVTVALRGNSYLTGEYPVYPEFKARNVYRFTATKKRQNFELILWNETNGSSHRRKEGSWLVLGKQNPQPIYIPIIVPAS